MLLLLLTDSASNSRAGKYVYAGNCVGWYWMMIGEKRSIGIVQWFGCKCCLTGASNPMNPSNPNNPKRKEVTEGFTGMNSFEVFNLRE